jgi:DNA polymerase III alpha subunit
MIKPLVTTKIRSCACRDKKNFSLIDEKTALEYFKDVPEAVGNTQLVVDLCEDYEIELGTAYFPEYKIESGKSADEELRTLAYAGFAFRNLEQKKEYVDRLEIFCAPTPQ